MSISMMVNTSVVMEMNLKIYSVTVWINILSKFAFLWPHTRRYIVFLCSFYFLHPPSPDPAPAVQTPCSLPPVPPGLPSLFTGSHSETGAVLRGPGGAGRTQPRLWLGPLHPETRPAARGGPQGQWPHRRMSGENACPSYDTATVQVPLSFLTGLESNASCWGRAVQEMESFKQFSSEMNVWVFIWNIKSAYAL